MTRDEMKQRRLVVVQRQAEITALLALSKHLWLTTGREAPRGVRSGLEYETAALNVERINLNVMIEAGKKASDELKRAHFTTMLVRVMNERGHGSLVQEANRASLDAIAALEAVAAVAAIEVAS